MNKVVFFSVLLIAGFVCESKAQFKLSIGPDLGMNYNFHHGASVSNSNVSYNGVGVAIGAQFDMSFSPVVGMMATITAYDMRNARGSRTVNQVKTVHPISLGYLMFNPAIKFTVPQTGLGFFTGPGIGFNIVGKSEVYQIAGGQRTQLQQKSDIMNTNIRINGQIGAFYDFDLSSLYLSPYLLFDYGFTDIAEGIEWKASGIKIGMVIKFKTVK